LKTVAHYKMGCYSHHPVLEMVGHDHLLGSGSGSGSGSGFESGSDSGFESWNFVD
jgi:hypothetical protein